MSTVVQALLFIMLLRRNTHLMASPVVIRYGRAECPAVMQSVSTVQSVLYCPIFRSHVQLHR